MEQHVSDEELMLLYQHGNQAAGATLFERYHGPLYGYLCRLLGNPEDARDLLQEVFLKVHASRETFTGRGRVKAWLYRIATTRGYNFLEQRGRLHGSGLVALENGEGGDLAVTASADTPRQACEEGEIRGALEEAIAQLPVKLRTVFLLRQDGGLDYNTMAGVLEEEPGNLRVLYHRARQKLFEAMRPWVGGGESSP